MRKLAVLFLSLCCYTPLATAQSGFAGKLDRQRATFRHIRQGCGNDTNTTNSQTLPATARTAEFTGGFGCPSFTSDNIRLNWVLPTSPITAPIPADNATTVALLSPAASPASVSISGSGAYIDSTSEVHSFFSRATLKEFTGGSCANAQKTANSNLEGIGSVDLAVSALCTLDQARFLTIVPGSIVKQNNQLTAFEAALTFEGVVDLAHGNQVGAPGWRGGAFTITVEAIYKFTVDVVQPPQPQAPRINRGGVVDAAQFQPALSPGGIATIFGTEFAASVVSASTVPLPTSLNGVRVLIQGIPAPLFFIAPGQINVQVPFEVPTGATVEVIVDRDGVQSPVETARVNQFAPAVFVDPTTKDPIATRFPDNDVISAANPARPGDVLILYLTGVGGLTSLPTTGQATPGSPLPESSLPATVTLGGQPVTVLYAGLSPFFIGLAQLNLQLPPSLPPGAKLPLLIRFGSAESQPVQLPLVYDAPPAPVIQVNPTSVNFGSLPVGQTLQRAITLSNSGTTSLTINAITLSNPRFAAPVSLPFSLAPGASRELFITFQPTTTGTETGTLTLSSNDPVTPQFTVSLAGTSSVPSTPGGVPAMQLGPTSLAFGDTAVGIGKELQLTIRNLGNGALQINSITSSQPLFRLTATTNVVIAPGAQQVFLVRFDPTAAGFVSGALAISSNDPARPSFTVPVTGTGFLPGAQTLVLQADDGSFERTVTIPDATEVHWLNRLTPPRYPATLKAVQIYFPGEGMVIGDAFTLLSASHPGNVANIGTPNFRTSTNRVPRTGDFVEFPVPELTINSGDFLVGFAAPIAPGQRPMAVDISGYQSRSFASLNGSVFQPIHLLSAVSQGNFAIRAVVDVK